MSQHPIDLEKTLRLLSIVAYEYDNLDSTPALTAVGVEIGKEKAAEIRSLAASLPQMVDAMKDAERWRALVARPFAASEETGR